MHFFTKLLDNRSKQHAHSATFLVLADLQTGCNFNYDVVYIRKLNAIPVTGNINQ